MSPSTTLYYPYIHPRRVGDLKAALLFWDRVRRIVPDSVTHGQRIMGDDVECVALADNGLLIATRPEPYESAAAETFFRCIEPQRGNLTIDLATASEMAARNRGIHIEKIGYPVLVRMQELGLAHRFGDWVHMHDQVGALYMFCLASEIARRMSIPLLSESSDESVLGEALLFEPLPGDSVTETLLQIGIEFPSGEQLAQVPAEHIIEFCHKRAAEKVAFREHIEGIAAIASATPDPNAVADYFSTHRVRMHAAIKDLRRSLEEIKVAGAMAFAKITVPAGVGAAISSLALPYSAAASLGAAGVVISAISCFAETRGKLRHARSSSPYHYLVAMKNDLGIKAVHDRREPAGDKR